MQSTQFNASKMFLILASASNKEVVKVEVGFLEVLDT